MSERCPKGIRVVTKPMVEKDPDGITGPRSQTVRQVLLHTCFRRNPEINLRVDSGDLQLMEGSSVVSASEACVGCSNNPDITLSQGRLFK